MKRLLSVLAAASVLGLAAAEIDLAKKGRVQLPGRAFTVALAITPEALTGVADSRLGWVCGLGTGYWDGFRLRLAPKRHGFEPSLEIGKPKGQGSFGLDAAGAVIPAGVTRHLAATWDGAVARVYLDGRIVAEQKYAGPYVADGPLSFLIARDAHGLGYYPFAHGAPRLWDEALAPDAVARLAAGVSTVSDAEVDAFLTRPVDEVMRDYAADRVEAKFRPLAAHLAYAALSRGLSENMPLKIVDAFAASIGTNDPHRVLDLRLYRARALLRDGQSAAGARAFGDVWREARDGKLPYAAWAGLAYARVLAEQGDAAGARKVRAEAAAFARSHLDGEFGRAPAPRSAPCPATGRPELEFFVSPSGSDAAGGSFAHPFATLSRARDAVRAVKAKGSLPAGGVTVWLRGGTYAVKETLALAAEDSGEPDAPVAWKAWKDERPVLDGGWRVPAFNLGWQDVCAKWPQVAARVPETARRHVRACDVGAAGYAHLEPQPTYGFYAGENSGQAPITDLYCGGSPLVLARHPNTGWLQTGEVLDGKTNHVFRSDADNLAQLRGEPELMVTGFWKWHWADATLRLAADGLDPVARTVALGRRAPELHAHRPYFFVNALCALDAPGEWFLDRASGLLLVWPRRDAADYVLSDFDAPFLALDKVHDLSVEGLVFQYGRGMAVKTKGCSALRFAGNVVRNFGNDGAWFLGARDVVVECNVFRAFGHGALRVSGGNRRTLEPSGISVRNNEIAWVERWKRTYAPGVHGDGCGTEIANNHFHDMRSSAMRLEGNDWWVASNIVERVVTESDDQGGIDIFANPTYAGDVICFNVWRDIGCGGENAPCGQAGVRFDDAVSGMCVYGNVFDNCSHGHFGGVQMNGGRNNIVDNNVFLNCAQGVSIGRWGQDRWEKYFQRPNVVHWRTKEVDVSKPPYSTKYPGIADLPSMPLVNWLTRNVTVGEGTLSRYPSTTVTYGNRAYATMPDPAALARDPAFRPLPAESELGPRRTAAFLRAKRNDNL